MNQKFWLFALPALLLGTVFAPQSTEGWSSACGCVNEDVEFAYFVTKNQAFESSSARVNVDSQLNEEIVAAGFLANIPLGSTLSTIEERSAFMQASCSVEEPLVRRCDYWLQFNSTHERGYSILFKLSKTNNLVSLEAKRIVRKKSETFSSLVNS